MNYFTNELNVSYWISVVNRGTQLLKFGGLHLEHIEFTGLTWYFFVVKI